MKANTLSLLIISAGTALLAGLANASRRPEYIDTPKATLLLLPAISIATGDVERQAWSSDGAYCAVVIRNKTKSWLETHLGPQKDPRRPDLPRVDVFVWSRADDQVKKLWSNDDPQLRIADLVWIHGTSELLVLAKGQRQVGAKGELHDAADVVAINALTGVSDWLPSLDNAGYVRLSASPTRPIVEMTVCQAGVNILENGGVICTLDRYAHVTHTQPVSLATINSTFVWSSDGLECYFADRSVKTPMKLNADGTLTKASGGTYAPPTKRPDLLLTKRAAVAKIRAETKSLDNLWLSSAITTDHPDAFISADGKQANVSPTQDAVFYVEGGVAKVRPWIQLSDDEKKALMDALKQDVLSCASSVALGLLMFAGDHGDNLPSPDELDGIMPYIQDPSLMEGLNYTPPSNLNENQWNSPMETVTGTIPGPGGSAVMYGDGHISWKPNP